MRGFPPIQIFILGLLFGLLAVPLVQLTGNAPPPAPISAVPVVEKSTMPALIRLRYAHRPLSISLKSDGRELLTKLDLSAPLIEIKAVIAVSHDGNEFSLEAKWPEGTPDTALTLEIEPEGYDLRSVTCWSSAAALSEILTLTW